MGRPKHPNKDIEAAVQYAESVGWSVKMSNGHAWGRLLCPMSTREGCIISVWSTPKDPFAHARRIRRDVDMCPHCPGGDCDEEEEDE
jgi:hypothetical protein